MKGNALNRQPGYRAISLQRRETSNAARRHRSNGHAATTAIAATAVCPATDVVSNGRCCNDHVAAATITAVAAATAIAAAAAIAGSTAVVEATAVDNDGRYCGVRRLAVMWKSLLNVNK